MGAFRRGGLEAGQHSDTGCCGRGPQRLALTGPPVVGETDQSDLVSYQFGHHLTVVRLLVDGWR